jgi:methionyl-tRNA formyltransferase
VTGAGKKRVLLLGLGPTALSALCSLAHRFEVVGVLRPAVSGAADDVAQRASALGIPLINDTSPASVQRLVARLRPDCTVVSSYDRILRPELLAICPFVNVHYAPLPAYRGRANVNWAIINGERETAITIHTIAPGLDAGNILYQETVPIGPDDTVAEVYKALNGVQRRALADTVVRHLDGFEGEPQDEERATYGCTRVPEDGHIDWSQSTERVYALVRALGHPYPPAYTYLGLTRLSVVRVLPVRGAPTYVGRVPGRVVSVTVRQGHVDVLTGDGVMRVYEVRVGDDTATVPAASIIRSTRQTLGLRAEDLVARIEALEARLDEPLRVTPN